jgi:hypothetical protein
VAISTNDPRNKEIAFSVKARLVGPIEASPNVVNYDIVPRDGKVAKEFVLMCCKDESYPEILSVSPSSSSLTVTKISSVEKQGILHILYKIELDPADAPLALRELVTVKTTSQRAPVFEVPVRASVPYAVDAKPARALFGIVAYSAQPVIEVGFAGIVEGKTPVEAKCPDPRVAAQLIQANGKDWRMKISLNGNRDAAAAPTLKTTVAVLDSAGKRLTEVPVHAIFVKEQ